MELYDVMRSTFAARDFTGDPLPNDTLFRILDNARFAPSGGNRQGWRGFVVCDRRTREALAALSAPAAPRDAAPGPARENPRNTLDPTAVHARAHQRTPVPAPPAEPFLR